MRKILALLAFIAVVPLLAADLDPCFPPKPRDQDQLLFRYSDFLSNDEAQRLNTKLVNFARETSNRIAIVVVDTLCGYPPSDFAFELGQAWGLGRKGIDNGVLVLVKPHGRAGDRHVFIATGYGLEGVIPDATAKRIVEDEILPMFRDGRFYQGLDQGTDILMELAKGEINAKSYGRTPFPWGIVLLVIGILVFFAINQRNRVRTYARTNNIDFWTAYWLLNQASRSHRGTWGGFSGGSGGGWSGGGGGGGGFGGFGGGSFGGGGAGGSW